MGVFRRRFDFRARIVHITEGGPPPPPPPPDNPPRRPASVVRALRAVASNRLIPIARPLVVVAEAPTNEEPAAFSETPHYGVRASIVAKATVELERPQIVLDSWTMTTCEIWKVTRLDGTVMGFTTHNKDIIYKGVTYYASRGGFMSTSISSTSDFAPLNLEVNGILDADAITLGDLLSRKFDNAELEISLLDWSDLTRNKIVLAVGKLGETSNEDNRFSVEVLGASKQLNQEQGDTIEKYCLAKFCDERCKLSASSFTTSGTVTAIFSTEPRRKFYGNVGTDPQYGELTWLTGANIGFKTEILNNTSPLELFELMPKMIQVGDTYSILAGCDKEYDTCKTRNNLNNFRGYGIFLPGRGGLLDYPDA